MNETEQIKIYHSKGKLTKLLFFCILFILIGIWMLISESKTNGSLMNNPIFKNVFGVLSIIMGLFGVYFFIKKLIDKQPGLIIDSIGIVENAGAFSLGRIPWIDISEIKQTTVQASIASKEKFITIMLKNPEDYIAKESNSFKRKALKFNAKTSGSPVHISTNGLAISFEDLKNILTEKFEEYRFKTI